MEPRTIKTRRRTRFLPPRVLAWLLLLSCLPIASAKKRTPKRKKKVESFPYLYATKEDPNASFPVIDYIAPVDLKGPDRPAFLYDTDQSYRIVEFYGHW